MATGPIKLGLVGLGRAGWGMHTRELTGKEQMFQIVAACDLIEDRRNAMAEKYQCRTYSDIADLIADPEVEVVDIATRSNDHFAHAKMALEAGKTVFLEKPICCTYSEAVKLQEIAQQTPGGLYIRHNRRFEPGFVHIQEIIASGILGDVYEIKLRRMSYSRRDDWQTIKAFGGGQMLNWGPHIIDHSLRLLESPLASLWSDLRCVAAAGDAEDHLQILLKGENGRLVDMMISGGTAISEPEYHIWGTRGALTCNGKTITMKYLNPEQSLPERTANPGTPEYGSFGTPEKLEWKEETFPIAPQGKAGMTQIWDELYYAIREGKPYPITLDQAVQVMYVVSEAKKGTPFE